MPPAAAFDYYQALEVEKDADTEAITASYRRLARVHHPDKDRENPHATAKFQQIQEAYETLSNPAKRSSHDNPSRRPQGNPYSSYPSPYDSDDDKGYGYDEEDVIDELMEEFLRTRFSCSRPEFHGFGSYGPPPGYEGLDGMSEEEYQILKEEMKEERRWTEARHSEDRKFRMQEYMDRVEAARAKTEAKAQAKKAEEEKKHMSQEQREKTERVLQEKTWTSLNATTPAEKQSSCLHSKFWPKEQQKKKFKCAACGQKRGPTGYKCPHCAFLSCQGCLSKMNEKYNGT
ncbi:DnAJ-like protein [Lachnellula hyalina]|uniref:DnAJ-like protein n=1 Tax=Lachnellula hyalina TaxID=1316788 RepID=A0A8H8RAM0_9HELO|nr:DnAJ-like protein [Lachnellula hyalina]TVY29870.1 DnAJ-like protein [Lachnellula hyalina]